MGETKERLDALASENAKLRENISSMGETKERLDALASENAKLRENITSMSETKERLDAENAKLREDVEIYDTEKAKLRNENRKMSEDLKSLRLRANIPETLDGYELDKTPIKFEKVGDTYAVQSMPNFESVVELLDSSNESLRDATLSHVYGVQDSDMPRLRSVVEEITSLTEKMSSFYDSGDNDSGQQAWFDMTLPTQRFLRMLKKYPSEHTYFKKFRGHADTKETNDMLRRANALRRQSLAPVSDDEDDFDPDELPSRDDIIDQFDTTTIVSTVANMINSDKPMDLTKLERSNISGHFGTKQDLDLERMINDDSRWEAESVESFQMEDDDDMDGEW